jgi:protein tyrosine phosphatase
MNEYIGEYLGDYIGDNIDNIYYYKDYMLGMMRYYMQPYIYKNNYYNISKITDNLYISDICSAMNKDKLKEEGITDILCTILGVYPIYPDEFKYKNIHVRDTEEEDIEKYFEECGEYIDNVIRNNGKILVHCSYGISRSATIVIAYLMKYKGMRLNEAYKYVKDRRDIIEPNMGFKIKLDTYDYKLFVMPIIKDQIKNS